MQTQIDLRSDTVTRPGPEMRRAMADAVVGDDVWGDDPTVIELQARIASMLGKDAALFVPTGTQSNLCALLSHCERGEEYLVGRNAHSYKYEAGGAAVLGSIQPDPIDAEPDGTLDLDQVRASVKPDDPHFARTKLLVLENTHDGKVLPIDYLRAARKVVDEVGLRLHLDGARIWNAAAALDVTEAEIAEPFDSISVCLSKGLGAPIGSLLVGSSEFVERSRRWRKMLGGGMRQSGIVAAAGLYALDHNRSRIRDDHAMADRLTDALLSVAGVEVSATHTNMVFATFENYGDDAAGRMSAAGILSAHQPVSRSADGSAAENPYPLTNGACRMVTHLDLPPDTPERVRDALVS